MKIILFFISMVTACLSLAQQGIISYTEEIQNPRAKEIMERMKMRGMKVDIPEVITNNRLLYFNENESMYKAKPKNEGEDDFDGRSMGNHRFSMRFYSGSGSENGFYRNIKDGSTLYEEEIIDRPFLVTGQDEPIQWKVTGRSESLGKYQVLEAVSINETDTLQAWFTPQIPVSTGPDKYGQLPGVILRVDVNNGKRMIYATNIDIRPLTDEEKIQKPEKGKKVSQEEFDAIREDKMKELKELYGEERAKRWME